MLYATKKRKPILIPLVLATLCVTGFYHLYNANAELKPILPPLAAHKNLQQWLIHKPDTLMATESLYHLEAVTEVYQQTKHKLLWLDNYELSNAGEQLLQHLHETSADELFDYNYHLSYLQLRLHTLPTLPSEAAALDILLTDAFISYADDVINDKLLPDFSPHKSNGIRQVAYHGPESTSEDTRRHIVKLLADNHKPRELTRILNNMTPAHEEYLNLREALNYYSTLLNTNEWQAIDPGPSIRPGERHPQVVQLRQMLKLYQDYPLPTSPSLLNLFSSQSNAYEQVDPNYFDENLEASLRRFQSRHGKEVDGILGRKTREILNVDPSYRIKQLALNMKRWRQLPKDLGERYIWINMTDYHLELMEDGKPTLDMKVIIGKSYRRTPMLQESIRTLVLNPQWNVPRSIALNDILPQMRKDPNYLRERNIRILKGWSEKAKEIPSASINWARANARNFPYRLRQDAGKGNALGAVKFVIPNDESIYLHDTSHPELFGKEFRALSSGCVRLEKPLELANALLDGKRGWDEEQVSKTLRRGKTTHLLLPQPVPTYLVYWTSWVDRDGVLQFRDDIYRRDKLPQTDQLEPGTLIL